VRACVKGCQTEEGPAEATRGLVCEKCYQGIEEALPKVPDTLAHLREIYAMPQRQDTDGSQRIRKDPPAPLNLHALDLTHQIFWALFESSPRADWEPWDFLEIAGAESDRILKHLPGIANSNKIRSLLPLPHLVRHAEGSFPTQERQRKTALPCPQCNKRTIYQPPQHYEDNLEVVCFDCGFRIPPEKMEFYANLAEKEAAQ
jgi:predicted RNA-binding Zn-ribbon protein involved in translation (DUF1610 family)